MKTEKTLKMIVLITLTIAASAFSNGKASEKDPKAENILAKFTEASGGKTALAKINNLTTHTKMEFVESGVTLYCKIIQNQLNHYYLRATSPQTGEMTMGFDGSTCWQTRRLETRKFEGKEKKSLLNNSAFLRFANWEKTLANYSYEGLINQDGIEMHKIKVFTILGMNETWYFNTTDNLLAKIEEPIELHDGPATAITIFSDYREVDGIKLPFVQKVIMPGQTRLISYLKIASNQFFDETIFAMPNN